MTLLSCPEHRDKHYRVEITEANLNVRKMTVTDFVLSSIEKTLLKTPAIYNYIEFLPRTFLATTGVQSWRQEDVFASSSNDLSNELEYSIPGN